MFLGFGLSVRGRGAGAGGARANAGLTLRAEPAKRGLLLDASPVHGEFRRWINDPAYADRVGYYAAGGPNSMLLQKPFADIFSFSRASKAWGFDSSGFLSEHAPDAIRQGYDRATGLPDGWRVEGAATNQIRGNRCEGAVVGSPGSVPTHWFQTALNGGLTREVVGSGAEDGIPYVDIRIFGTTNFANANWRLELSGALNAVPAASGQVWSSAVYLRLLAGSFPSIAQLYLYEFSSTPGQIGQSAISLLGIGNGPLATQRPGLSRSFTEAATAYATTALYFVAPTSGTPVEFTIRVGAPQLEQGPWPTSAVLHPPGAPSAATRSSDLLAVSGSAFTSVFGAGGSGFLIMDVLLPVSGFQGSGRTFAELSDGTTANRLQFRANSTGGAVIMLPVTAGVTGAVISNVSPIYGTPMRVGMRWDKGAHTSCVNGGGLASGTGAALAFNRLNFGIDVGSNPSSALSGRIRLAAGGVRVPTDAQLQAACAANANIETAIAA